MRKGRPAGELHAGLMAVDVQPSPMDSEHDGSLDEGHQETENEPATTMSTGSTMFSWHVKMSPLETPRNWGFWNLCHSISSD